MTKKAYLSSSRLGPKKPGSRGVRHSSIGSPHSAATAGGVSGCVRSDDFNPSEPSDNLRAFAQTAPGEVGLWNPSLSYPPS